MLASNVSTSAPYHLPDALFDILRGFAALCSPHAMAFPSDLPFTEVREFFLESILLNPHFRTYPPSRQYQSSFWKWAVHNLERLLADEDAEVDQRIYDRLISLMPRSAPGDAGSAPPCETYVTYIWKSRNNQGPESVTLLESRTMIESGTTGLRTWSASYVLAYYLISHPELVRGKRVLELGSGTGFLGLVIAALQQHPVRQEHAEPSALWLTDVNSAVLQRCRDNTRLPCNASSRHPNLNCQLLDWTDVVDPLSRPWVQTSLREMDADVVVGADLVYVPSIIPALLEVIRLTLTSRSTTTRRGCAVAFVALTVRNEDTFAQFLNLAGEKFSMREVDTDVDEIDMFVGGPELQNRRQVKIFEMKSK